MNCTKVLLGEAILSIYMDKTFLAILCECQILRKIVLFVEAIACLCSIWIRTRHCVFVEVIVCLYYIYCVSIGAEQSWDTCSLYR